MSRLARLLFAAALVIPLSSAPAHARSSGCLLNVLTPAPGTPANGTSWVLDADNTGRHLLGESTTPERAMRPVLWTEGVPQWLNPRPEFSSEAFDVNDAGTVIGATGDAFGGSHPWVYHNGVYTKLAAPAGVTHVQLTGINKHGDIVGHGVDEITSVVVVWPGGGRPPVKLVAKQWARGLDISDTGAVVGETIDGGRQVSWVWEDWTKPGRQLPGKVSSATQVHAVRGAWVGGNEITNGVKTGIVWDTAGAVVATHDAELNSVNAQGDSALAPTGTDGSAVVRLDGTRMQFPQWSNVYHLFDRGQNASAAGYVDGGNHSAVAALWSGCTPPDHT